MVVAFKQIFCSKKNKKQNKTKQKQKNKKTKQKQKQKTKKPRLVYFDYFLVYEFLQNLTISQLQILFQTTSTNILSMFSFLFNTFINLYLGLVISYIRDLNPQYNFSITAS